MTVEGTKPLFEDPAAAAELREFARMARNDGPSQADLDRLASRLGPALGISSAALAVTSLTALGTAPAQVGLAPVAAKLGLFAQLVSSTGGKLLALGLSLGAGVAAFGYLRSPAPAVQAVEQAPSAQLEPAVQEQPAPVQAPVALAPVEEPAPQAKRAPLRRREPAAAPAPAPQAAPTELSLMKQAGALRAQPQQALAVLAQHEALYPRGALAQEREMLSIELLVKDGQLTTANQRAAQFRRQFPGSAHLPRLESLLTRAAAQ